MSRPKAQMKHVPVLKLEEDEITFRAEVMGCGVLNDYWLNVPRNYRELEVKSNFCWFVSASE